MSVLVFIIGFVVYAMSQKGPVGGSQSGQQSGQQGNSQGTQQTPQPSPPPTTQQASTPATQPARDAAVRPDPKPPSPANPPKDDGGIAELFRKQQSDTWIETSAVIKKVLPDDSTGDKHQRFIAKVSSGIEVLIAHNIDIAPRVPAEEGDTILFRGEYEWTEKGGTVHFTHAPKFKRREPGGWIEFEGKRYE
jgi:hypothetical protein